MGKLQLTLAVLKPQVLANPPIAKEIKKIILDNGFLFVRSRVVQLTAQRAEDFYGEHKGKGFYDELVEYMTSGPVSGHILARDDAITAWRNLMGPTKIATAIKEAPTSLRARFGLNDTQNAVHGSDSEKSAKREMAFYFPEFDMDVWYEGEELLFRKRSVKLDEEIFQHHAVKIERQSSEM